MRHKALPQIPPLPQKRVRLSIVCLKNQNDSLPTGSCKMAGMSLDSPARSPETSSTPQSQHTNMLTSETIPPSVQISGAAIIDKWLQRIFFYVPLPAAILLVIYNHAYLAAVCFLWLYV